MRNDIYSQQILDEQDLISAYLTDPSRILQNALVSDEIKFDDILEVQNKPTLVQYIDPKLTVAEFDKQQQSKWFMPEEYKQLDIAKWVLEQCKSDAELQRVGEELIKFQERDLFPLLQYTKYLVDTMRQHNVLWGVGRGSSVASYVLYLIGVHRINSLHFDLSIDEFLK
jgi:DNA polymerase III alpha subunit